mmetsp:Transcript_2698/g.2349  ORF Transcript_2698/g.2349 Transcript_2698/m.2349 type:complete len:80 (+) Transcript_2698:2342-2581(+)|eukprot:CAMPEP_0114591678 /NCGR_PEP_ID=MMETSP0125-20121206/13670_1 /TAXON_ID=485358 ORGANISM="Aristerostoma sp., Strain ATCC 50986" /NCGR_SAMPLE_ID=MMETSP0125 /ASSEMBLY_ACC=CAM_ASM_000245 /LENGTH=79 /DNA_ID=CAMNT_0001789893 /DNA_START=2995 /DNA_END=3234 /DNA_ORIENTATION=-
MKPNFKGVIGYVEAEKGSDEGNERDVDVYFKKLFDRKYKEPPKYRIEDDIPAMEQDDGDDIPPMSSSLSSGADLDVVDE